MYKACKAITGTRWQVQKQYSCINGLSAWFAICSVEEPSRDEVAYTDGALPTAQQTAENIAEALNK